MARLGVVTGLVREIDCLKVFPAEERPLVQCQGIGARRAARAAEDLVSQGCGALLSFGIAGGLDPELKTGTPFVGEAVIDLEGRRYPTDDGWLRGLVARLAGRQPLAVVAVAGSARVVADEAAKLKLFKDTGAAAVDMESHAVAAVARTAGVPFLVLRAVSDGAGGKVPEAAIEGTGADGRVRPWALAGALLRRPGDLPGMIRLGRDSAAALAALRRVAAAAGPRFGLD